jgi:hypothetical protein
MRVPDTKGRVAPPIAAAAKCLRSSEPSRVGFADRSASSAAAPLTAPAGRPRAGCYVSDGRVWACWWPHNLHGDGCAGGATRRAT